MGQERILTLEAPEGLARISSMPGDRPDPSGRPASLDDIIRVPVSKEG